MRWVIILLIVLLLILILLLVWIFASFANLKSSIFSSVNLASASGAPMDTARFCTSTLMSKSFADWLDDQFDAPALRRRTRPLAAGRNTMIGLSRLGQRAGVRRLHLGDGVAGDLIETGVWRGGTTILRSVGVDDPERRGFSTTSYRPAGM